jgi:phosphatidate cytidylyltransferase
LIVAGADPINSGDTVLPAVGGSNNLVLRVGSALVMVPLALGAAYLGGQIFLAFWTFAALVVLWEWDALVCAHDKNPVFMIGSVTIVGTCLLWAIDRPVPALMLIALGMLGVATLASKIRRAWCVVGVVYAGSMLIAPVVLRADPTLGFATILFLFAVVWSTDIAAYAVGRVFGGPKLMLRVSPNKTWTGAIGGMAAGIGGGIGVGELAQIDNLLAVGLVALMLSVASQAGDLLESAIKRRFNVKDASWLIPGHGGLMDRLDGFVTASAMAVIIGLMHGGVAAPGRGLLVW